MILFFLKTLFTNFIHFEKKQISINLSKRNYKQALAVRFADIVQKIDPPTRLSSSNSSPQINRLGSISNEHDSYFVACELNNDHHLMSCISTTTTKTTKYHLTPGGGGPKMKMRRSMSVIDMNIFYTIRSIKNDALQEFLTFPKHLHEIRKWRLSDKLGLTTTDQSLCESFEFTQKLEEHQTATPTNAALDWRWYTHTKRSYEQK
jgi:hypothetical protein